MNFIPLIPDISNTAEKATELWQFLHGEATDSLPESWTSYLEIHTQLQANKKMGAYTTRRDSENQYQAWRAEITENALTKIEKDKHCVSAIQLLGYNLFGNIDTARNLSYPLFV